LYKESVRTAL